MANREPKPIDPEEVRTLLNRQKGRMKRYLSFCAHCGLCADSCFLYRAHHRDPHYMPSYKVIHSLGKLYKKRGRVDRRFFMEIKEMVWKNCVLCGRCYCPVGIHIPSMITFTRSICRSQGVYPEPNEISSESWL